MWPGARGRPYVKRPRHGYLAASGHDWECERSYEKSGDTCVAMVLPANAHIGYFVNTWTCDPGYTQQDRGCVPEVR